MRAFIFMGRPPPEDGEDLYGYCRLTYKKSSKYTPTAAETAEANRKEDAKAAAKDAKENATGEETKSDGKYDTRAIEAAYLAGAQAKQAEKLANKFTVPFQQASRIGQGLSNKLQMAPP